MRQIYYKAQSARGADFCKGLSFNGQNMRTFIGSFIHQCI